MNKLYNLLKTEISKMEISLSLREILLEILSGSVSVLIFIGIIGAVALVDFFFIQDPISTDRPQTLEERIAILSSNLEQTSRTISEIEVEITQRQQLVRQLEQQRQTAEQVSQLNKEQVEAVAQLLRGEVRANESQSFWVNVGISALFFVLGLIAPAVTRPIRRKLGESLLSGAKE